MVALVITQLHLQVLLQHLLSGADCLKQDRLDSTETEVSPMGGQRETEGKEKNDSQTSPSLFITIKIDIESLWTFFHCTEDHNF